MFNIGLIRLIRFFIRSIKRARCAWSGSDKKRWEKCISFFLEGRQTDDAKFGQLNVSKWNISGSHKWKVEVDDDVNFFLNVQFEAETCFKLGKTL